MSLSFPELAQIAGENPSAFSTVPREQVVRATREDIAQRRDAIRKRHDEGESGSNVVHMLAEAADAVLCSVFRFGLTRVVNRDLLASRVAFCALGGYGRGELSPYSDLDTCLIYEGQLDDNIRALNAYLIPFLWDIGFVVGYTLRSVDEAAALINEDMRDFTSFTEARLLAGNSTVFARLKLIAREAQFGRWARVFVAAKARERIEDLPSDYRDLFHPEPNVKESAGGLRDLHTALWMLQIEYGAMSLEHVVGQGLITSDEHLEIVEALDFVWRIRNQLHYHAGSREDRLTFANQRHVAKAFGYKSGEHENIFEFMRDYYASARRLRRFLKIAAQLCNGQFASGDAQTAKPLRIGLTFRDGELYAGENDPAWFAHNPARLMDLFWECARREVRLSRATQRMVTENLHLVNETFRSSDLVRRYFVAVCNRPYQSGMALRQAANCGFLDRYLPEFGAVRDVIRYEGFHHYPVDEHTLRAIESLALLQDSEEPAMRCLQTALEHLSDPYVLVMAVLFHDLGKAEGDVHVAESVRLTRQICRRIGMTEYDEERIAFLVEHHTVMNHISQWRDVDDDKILRDFTQTMRTEQLLRALFLLSYADLYAVGPNVWNEWKGALLMKLYLRSEKILLGRVETVGEAYWETSKAARVHELAADHNSAKVEEHLKTLGERYLMAFTPEQIAMHIDCVARAERTGLALHHMEMPATGMSEVVVCTRDKHGLFSRLAGSFSSLLVDINSAAVFTRPDGFVVDCFTVVDAHTRRPITSYCLTRLEQIMRQVVLEDKDVLPLVDASRKRLFALLQPVFPVPTRIEFDNDSSATHTVVDIETGDRTGLLYDITRSLSDAGIDIASARIVTDARHVRDSFYVTRNGLKITENDDQALVRDGLRNAIHPRSAA
jgi:[protein-PII] uridylyltransferase